MEIYHVYSESYYNSLSMINDKKLIINDSNHTFTNNDVFILYQKNIGYIAYTILKNPITLETNKWHIIKSPFISNKFNFKSLRKLSLEEKKLIQNILRN